MKLTIQPLDYQPHLTNMAEGYLISGESVKKLASTVKKVDAIVPSFVTPPIDVGSDVILVPVKVSDGTDGIYSGDEQSWDTTAGGWVNATGGISWAPDGSIGPLIEMNLTEDLDGSVFYATYFGDTNDDIVWVFSAGVGGDSTAGYMDFRHYIDSSGDLRFYDGTYWVEEDNGVVVSDGGGFSIDSSTTSMYWVEVTTDYESAASVNTTIQSGDMTAYLADDGTTLTAKVPLLEIIDGTIFPMREGDIFCQSFFSPEYDADIQGAEANSVKILGDKSAISSSAGLNYFFEGKLVTHKFLGGNLVDKTDGTAVKFGGATANGTFEYINDMTSDTTNEIKLSFGDYDYNSKRGLMEGIDHDASTRHQKIKSFKWIGIETGRNPGIIHKKSPVASTGDADHWETVEWDGTNLTVDGTQVSSINIDNRGHIWEINGSGAPDSSVNYKYTHCNYELEDIILDTSQADSAIEVDGECYLFDGTTEEAATSPAPTVDGTYVSCSSCEAAAVNEVWKKCADGSQAAILSPGLATDDYAWLCLSSVWVKCYDSGEFSSSTPDDPSVLEMESAFPTDCSDLTGIPWSDGFDGTGTDSTSVGDDMWNYRWDYAESAAVTSSRTITSGNLVTTAKSNNGATQFQYVYNDQLSITGDFVVEMDVVSVNASTSGYRYYQFHLIIGADTHRIVIGENAVDPSYYQFASEGKNAIAYSWAARTLKITRQSDNKIRAYVGGTLVGTSSNTYTGTLTQVKMYTGTDSTSVTTSVSTTSLTIEDTLGNPYTDDPTGKSCT